MFHAIRLRMASGEGRLFLLFLVLGLMQVAQSGVLDTLNDPTQLDRSIDRNDTTTVESLLSIVESLEFELADPAADDLKLVAYNTVVQPGWRLATVAEAKSRMNYIKKLDIGRWSIASLEDGQVTGSGHGWKVKYEIIGTDLKLLIKGKCKAKNGRVCVFPLRYKGKTYNSCTNAHHNRFWCATRLNNDGTYDSWDNCMANYACSNQVNGQWTAWGQWSGRNGDLSRRRTRSCSNPAPRYGGRSCAGNNYQTTSKAHGEWGAWGQWSSFSVCPHGCLLDQVRTRTRLCNNPAPRKGGKPCPSHIPSKEYYFKNEFLCSAGNKKKALDAMFPAFISEMKTTLNKIKSGASWSTVYTLITKYQSKLSSDCVSPKSAVHPLLATGCASKTFCKDYKKYTSYLSDISTRNKDTLTTKNHNVAVLAEIVQTNFDDMAKYITGKVIETDSKFRQDFGGYLKTISEFDLGKAKNDMLFVQENIADWKKKMGGLNTEITGYLSDILQFLIIKTRLDMGTAAVRLAAATAQGANPLGYLFGTQDGGDIEDEALKVAKAAKATVTIASLGYAWQKCFSKAADIKKRMLIASSQHQVFLDLVNANADGKLGLKYVRGQVNTNTCPSAILTEESCKSAAHELGGDYRKSGHWSDAPKGCYTYLEGASKGKIYWNKHSSGSARHQAQPLCVRQEQKELATKFVNSWGKDGTVGVRKSDVTAYLESLKGLLDTACDIVNSDDSALGTASSTVMIAMGFCSGTKVGPKIAELEALYEQTIAGEDELMTAGIDMAKAILSRNLADSVIHGWDKNENLDENYVVGLMLSFKYRMEVVKSACDAFEYRNYGRPIDICTNLIDKPFEKEDIKQLASYVNKVTSCDDSPRNVLIPASIGTIEKGHIDLLALYNGTATFEVPSCEYAKKHGWFISSHDCNSGVYVKKFMLQLPPHKAIQKTPVEILITHEYDNILTPEGALFPLSVDDLKTEYSNGDAYCNSDDPYEAPACNSVKIKSCTVNDGSMPDNAYFLPALYGKWTIRLVNNHGASPYLTRLAMPEPVDVIYLRAKVITCTRSRHHYMFHHRVQSSLTSGKCCIESNTVTDYSGKSYCKACPVDSNPALNGYYCKGICSCVGRSDGAFPHPQDDSKYCVCKNGVLSMRKCAKNYRYVAKDGKCTKQSK